MHGLAGSLGLTGFVGNGESGLLLEAQGDGAAVRKFLAELSDRPPALAVRLLRGGAVKGLGGFRLAAIAGGPVGEAAVARLRARKHREDKPFAVLVADLDAARELVTVDDVAAELLTSRGRPIMLLPRFLSARLASRVGARSGRRPGAGVDTGVIAAQFHNGVVEARAGACTRARAETGLGVVALSRGVFQNVVLTRRLRARLCTDGFEVLTHHRVPTNDAGISLGQVAIAAARDRELRVARG